MRTYLLIIITKDNFSRNNNNYEKMIFAGNKFKNKYSRLFITLSLIKYYKI